MSAEDSNIYGLEAGQVIWTDDFKATRDKDGKWKGSESFFCKVENTISLLPKNGDPCRRDGWSFLVCTGTEVANNKGNVDKVTVTYGGVDPNSDGGGDGGDDIDKLVDGWTWNLTTATGEEPIMTNYRYAKEGNIPKNEQYMIQLMLKGDIQPHIDPNTNEWDGKFVQHSTDSSIKIGKLTSAKAKEVVGKFIAKGVTSYLLQGVTARFTRTWVGTSLPTYLLNNVGFIQTPPPATGFPTVTTGRTWLYSGIEVNVQTFDKATGKATYELTLEYRLSGIGGWSPELYDKTMVQG